MKQLLYIGMEFHKQTRSADFLLELLGREYEITLCLVDVFVEDPYAVFAEVGKHDFDVLACWQVMPPRDVLDLNFRFRHAVFFPMLDSCPSVSKPEKWFPYRDSQIISFSRTLARQLVAAGFSAHAIQYFPEATAVPEWGDPDGVFFWNRREAININTVTRLLCKTKVQRIHIHKALDPGYRFIPPPADSPLEFSYSEWYTERDGMQKDMLKFAYYVAPRQKEGIGMSFLEAMAMGRCVVAPNSPTMNEYIEHGRTGLLYNVKHPSPIEIDQVKEIQKNTHGYMREGFEKWEREKANILDWLVAPVSISLPRMTVRLILRFFRNPAKVSRVLRKESRNRRS